MTIGSQEHYDMMEQFEKDYHGEDLTKENKDMWKMGQFYANGLVNKLFKAYCKGYSLARCVYR